MQSANAKYTLYFTHHKYQMQSICISVQITVQMCNNEHRNTLQYVADFIIYAESSLGQSLQIHCRYKILMFTKWCEI